MVEIVQNFIIKDGRVFDLNGDEIVGPNGVWVPRVDKLAGKPGVRKTKRWYRASWLTVDQETDESYQKKMKIA